MACTSRNSNPKNSAGSAYHDIEVMKAYEFFYDRFPVGYKFQPSDEELVFHYLTNKLLHKPLPTNKVIDLNIYDYSPMQLAEMHKFREEEAMYFFSPTEKKYPNGKRPNRVTGSDGHGHGSWKATGKDKEILNERKKVVGVRKTLVFHVKISEAKKRKTDWIMHEFKIIKEISRTARAPHDNRLDNWVLCKVYLSKMFKPDSYTTDKEEIEMTDSEPLGRNLPVFESSADPNLGEQYQSVQAAANDEIMAEPYGGCSTGFESQEDVTNLGSRSHVDHQQYLSEVSNALQQPVINIVSSPITSLAGGDSITIPYVETTSLKGSEENKNIGENLPADHPQGLPFPEPYVIDSDGSAIASLGNEVPHGFGDQHRTNVAPPPTTGMSAHQYYQFPHGFEAHQSLPRSDSNVCLPPLPQEYHYYDDDLPYGSFWVW